MTIYGNGTEEVCVRVCVCVCVLWPTLAMLFLLGSVHVSLDNSH